MHQQKSLADRLLPAAKLGVMIFGIGMAIIAAVLLCDAVVKHLF